MISDRPVKKPGRKANMFEV